MTKLGLAATSEHLRPQGSAGSTGFTANEIVPKLVGRSIKEVERGLIIHTLAHHHGNRTLVAGILGVSIRTLRNKISYYRALGFTVPAPARPKSLSQSA
jgi:DNA-binding NtrC family response regulator